MGIGLLERSKRVGRRIHVFTFVFVFSWSITLFCITGPGGPFSSKWKEYFQKEGTRSQAQETLTSARFWLLRKLHALVLLSMLSHIATISQLANFCLNLIPYFFGHPVGLYVMSLTGSRRKRCTWVSITLAVSSGRPCVRCFHPEAEPSPWSSPTGAPAVAFHPA